jgi:hypothetical protein
VNLYLKKIEKGKKTEEKGLGSWLKQYIICPAIAKP